jgi:hypothetical protein
LRIVEVEEKREIGQVFIDQFTEVSQGILDEYFLNPMKLITMTQDFIKRTTQELILEVSTKIYNGELDLEKMQSSKLEEILKEHALWKEYRDHMEAQRIASS